LKILETYVLGAPGVRRIEDAKHQLYHAVIDGEVRARHKGRVLDAESLHEIRSQKWGNEPYDLPSDMELSVVDAEAVWPEPEPTDADLKLLVERKFKVLEGIVGRLEKGETGGRFPPLHEYEEQWIDYARLAELQVEKVRYSHLQNKLRGHLQDLQERFDHVVSTIGHGVKKGDEIPTTKSKQSSEQLPIRKGFSQAKARQQYIERVKELYDSPPSREDDETWGHERGCSRDFVRALRNELAPEHWTQRGRRKTGKN
jgi:hypothetical protein